MDAQDHLFYGFGQVVYSIALADGNVQREEARKLAEDIETASEKLHISLDAADIIFQLLEREGVFTPEETYSEGIKNMKLGSHKLTEELAEAFRKILIDVAASYPPVTIDERAVLEAFEEDLKSLR